ncbi:hypothetical protein ABW19_dt0207337 [Dactylella cylindrospora]|nr:hypothetical protein ABW19_dt0207337 [Dactylella cylindrospora]
MRLYISKTRPPRRLPSTILALIISIQAVAAWYQLFLFRPRHSYWKRQINAAHTYKSEIEPFTDLTKCYPSGRIRNQSKLDVVAIWNRLDPEDVAVEALAFYDGDSCDESIDSRTGRRVEPSLVIVLDKRMLKGVHIADITTTELDMRWQTFKPINVEQEKSPGGILQQFNGQDLDGTLIYHNPLDPKRYVAMEYGITHIPSEEWEGLKSQWAIRGYLMEMAEVTLLKGEVDDRAKILSTAAMALLEEQLRKDTVVEDRGVGSFGSLFGQPPMEGNVDAGGEQGNLQGNQAQAQGTGQGEGQDQNRGEPESQNQPQDQGVNQNQGQGQNQAQNLGQNLGQGQGQGERTTAPNIRSQGILGPESFIFRELTSALVPKKLDDPTEIATRPLPTRYLNRMFTMAPDKVKLLQNIQAHLVYMERVYKESQRIFEEKTFTRASRQPPLTENINQRQPQGQAGTTQQGVGQANPGNNMASNVNPPQQVWRAGQTATIPIQAMQSWANAAYMQHIQTMAYRQAFAYYYNQIRMQHQAAYMQNLQNLQRQSQPQGQQSQVPNTQNNAPTEMVMEDNPTGNTNQNQYQGNLNLGNSNQFQPALNQQAPPTTNPQDPFPLAFPPINPDQPTKKISPGEKSQQSSSYSDLTSKLLKEIERTAQNKQITADDLSFLDADPTDQDPYPYNIGDFDLSDLGLKPEDLDLAGFGGGRKKIHGSQGGGSEEEEEEKRQESGEEEDYNEEDFEWVEDPNEEGFFRKELKRGRKGG